jgi:L-ascorbate metabolism protein UlaG (beta-lactamase superfamily)
MPETQLQFLGHATFKVITPEGKIILVDPWLTNNPFIPAAYQTQDKIDYIIVTHGHDDHFDINMPQIIANTNATFVGNNICRWYLMEKGVPQKNIQPINLGGTVNIDEFSKLTMVNAFHISHINVTDTKMIYPHQAVGFVLHLSDGMRIYFAGDTSVFGDMKLIGEIYKPTIAALPIGDCYTMGPLEASYAVRLLNVKHVLPFHYGTYPSLTGTPAELARLTSDIADLKIHALKAGEFLTEKIN